MRKRKLSFVISLLSLILFISACGKSEETASGVIDLNKPQIVTSIFPVYEIVREIAGDQADVHLMVGASEDAHHFEPSAKSILLVNEADAFIYSSDEMEFWAKDILKVVENNVLHIIELAEGMDLEIGTADDEHIDYEAADDHDGHDHGNIDPHIWLDPVVMGAQVPMLVETLTEIDPAGASVYQENGAQLATALEELDAAYRQSFQDATKRTFVVQHKAFGHLAKRYDLTQMSVGGLSTEVEPNPKDLIQIIHFVEDNQTEVIFYQSGDTSAVAETIAAETGAEFSVLYDLENKPEGIEESGNIYLKAMYHNLEELKKVIY